MELCRTKQLMLKPVINICDGNRLGCIADLEIDCCSGRICSVFVPMEWGCFGLFHGEELMIPWDKIKKIGEDSVLVELTHISDHCRRAEEECRSKSKTKFFRFFGF